jgi:hypothetical protein
MGRATWLARVSHVLAYGGSRQVLAPHATSLDGGTLAYL